jgi:hypothetical protein
VAAVAVAAAAEAVAEEDNISAILI